jgi:hypothetical protein
LFSGMISKINGSLLLLALLALPASAQVGPPDPTVPSRPKPSYQQNNTKNFFHKLLGMPVEEPKSAEKKPTQSAPTQSASPDTASSPQRFERPPLLAPAGDPQVRIEPPVASPENPPAKTPLLDNPNNPLGLMYADKRLKQAQQQIAIRDFAEAKAILKPLRQWLIDATEAHITLYKSLENVANARAQAEMEKQVALQFALMRDEALFELGRLEVEEKNHQAAVKTLTDVVKSQPRSGLGLKAYALLQQIGFTEKLQLTD